MRAVAAGLVNVGEKKRDANFFFDAEARRLVLHPSAGRLTGADADPAGRLSHKV